MGNSDRGKDQQRMQQQLPQGGQAPQKDSASQQGAGGDSGQQQAQGGQGQQYGEGSYSGTRQYNEGVKKHMEQHDVEGEARAAQPRSEEEARQMEEAERVGRSKSKGEDGRGLGDGGVERQGQ